MISPDSYTGLSISYETTIFQRLIIGGKRNWVSPELESKSSRSEEVFSRPHMVSAKSNLYDIFPRSSLGLGKITTKYGSASIVSYIFAPNEFQFSRYRSNI